MGMAMIVLLQPSEEHYKLALERAGYHVTVGNAVEQHEHRDAVALVNAENAAAQLREWRQTFARVRPIVIGDPARVLDTSELSVAAAPTLSTNAAPDELLRALAFLSRGGEWLLRELLELDRNAKRLVDDELCQWVRARPGIIGSVLLARFADNQQPTNLLRRLIEHAYNLLDGLPQDKLSVQDIWNVTLLIAVPTTESELDRSSDIAKLLHSISLDVTGSRKVVLWLDRRVRDYFGPLGEGRHLWKLSSSDPLRRTLDHLASDQEERQALEVVFKRRLAQEDIDELLRILSRRS